MIEYCSNEPIPAGKIAKLRCAVGWKGMQKFYESAKMNSYWHIAAMDGENLIGHIDCVSNNLTDAYIQDLMVDPDYQNRGIGTTLMNMMIEKLKRDKIYMISVIFEEKLQPFYRRFGFHPMLAGQLQTF